MHVCVGEDDLRISRSQGSVTFRGGRWWISNTGHRALQLPRSMTLFPEDDPYPVEAGYTPVFVNGTARRRHLLELYVADQDGRLPRPAPDAATLRDKPWKLRADERLALVSLAQKYLLHEAYPQPCTWQQVADRPRRPAARRAVERQARGASRVGHPTAADARGRARADP